MQRFDIISHAAAMVIKAAILAARWAGLVRRRSLLKLSIGCGDVMDSWSIKQRFGAVGKHGSIAVTERVIKSFKYEWLNRVPLIRGFSHIECLCASFQDWYNNWRPHMRLNGFLPCDYYTRDIPDPIPKTAKCVPTNIEVKRFKETRVTGYRLKNAA